MSEFCRNRIKVGPTFSSFNPFLSLPFIETDKKNSLIFFGIQLVRRHVLA